MWLRGKQTKKVYINPRLNQYLLSAFLLLEEAKLQDAVLSSCTGQAGGHAGGLASGRAETKNEPLVQGLPNLVERFVPTPS